MDTPAQYRCQLGQPDQELLAGMMDEKRVAPSPGTARR